MPAKSTSELSNISKMPEISSTDKSRPPNKAAISRFLKSKLFIKPDMSRLSKSRLSNLNIGIIAAIRSEVITISIRSDIAIADKS